MYIGIMLTSVYKIMVFERIKNVPVKIWRRIRIIWMMLMQMVAVIRYVKVFKILLIF